VQLSGDFNRTLEIFVERMTLTVFSLDQARERNGRNYRGLEAWRRLISIKVQLIDLYL